MYLPETCHNIEDVLIILQKTRHIQMAHEA